MVCVLNMDMVVMLVGLPQRSQFCMNEKSPGTEAPGPVGHCCGMYGTVALHPLLNDKKPVAH